ncbi:hypothetical protein [Novosphingobium mangrovi (ex Hu et al. 2023)]|uniref:Uncharacterized protein n=1 Tax=Novosphingobium mangrovi (ex Hu et al. 2023) TaxID=2930094 RepID=A0ABT0AG59_9SPHN|nr:hypothetical protein [Novosphingobium mangrovi (ex Hu et al. 2023)]MCJ1962151.1 hypothetical protein [Novosphingobium mangrovi (ex Hu et al. 2023)]
MLLTLAIALVVFGLLSAPGWIVASRHSAPLWIHAAAGCVSASAALLLTALVARLLPGQLDVRWLMGSALLLAGLAAYWRWGRGDRESSVPGSACAPERAREPQAFVVGILATGVAAAITAGAVRLMDGELVVRAWFNADGFKHLGHVNALALMGLPARDIFAAGDPLAYYWLFYTIPACAAALGADPFGALVAQGLIQTLVFWVILHGLLRQAGASPNWAMGIALIGWLSPSPDGLFALLRTGGDLSAAATQINIEGVNGGFLNGYPLFRASLYVPQHQFMLLGLLSWGVIFAATREQISPLLKRVSVLPLICAGAVSTLLGVACLGVYGLARLCDTRTGLTRRVFEIGAVGLCALAVPLLFGIVGPGAGDSGLDSPIFAAARMRPEPWVRLLLALPGLVLLFGVSLFGLVGLREVLVRQMRRRSLEPIVVLTSAICGVGMAVLLGSTLIGSARIAQEMQLRVAILTSCGLTIACVWLVCNGPRADRRALLSVGLPLLILGMASPVLDTLWHVASVRKWQLRVPADDLAVLAAVRKDTARDAVFLQYPALPFVSLGPDVWIPILAGRQVLVSPRATHWARRAPQYDAALRFFDERGALPEGDYDYVYLSRSLHPDSYEEVMARMEREKGWQKGACRANACLWQRVIREDEAPGDTQVRSGKAGHLRPA